MIELTRQTSSVERKIERNTLTLTLYDEKKFSLLINLMSNNYNKSSRLMTTSNYFERSVALSSAFSFTFIYINVRRFISVISKL